MLSDEDIVTASPVPSGPGGSKKRKASSTKTAPVDVDVVEEEATHADGINVGVDDDGDGETDHGSHEEEYSESGTSGGYVSNTVRREDGVSGMDNSSIMRFLRADDITSEEMGDGSDNERVGKTQTVISMAETQNTLDHLRKNSKDVCVNLPVSCIINIFQDNTDICLPSLYRLDLMEFIDMLKRLKLSLDDTLLPISTSSQHTTATSTSHTFAPTQITVVDALGSRNVCMPGSSGVPNFGGLLSPGNSSPSTIAEYRDTYLRAQDASTELVVSTKLNDYLVDINIDRYVLILKLLHKRTELLNEKKKKTNNVINIIKPMKPSPPVLDIAPDYPASLLSIFTPTRVHGEYVRSPISKVP